MTSSSSRNHFSAGRVSAALVAGLLTLTGAALLGAGASAAPGAQAAEPWVISPRRAAVPNPVPKTAQAIAQGQDLYKSECATCHGQRGQNDGPGAKKIAAEMKEALLLTDPRVHEQSDGALFVKITEGRGKMPSLEKDLTDDERWHIVHFVRTFAPANK
jgi:mono/diheme cytochrome c family protein